MQDTIIKYIHHPKKPTQRIGVVVASKLVNDPSKVGIGWSLTAVSKGDRFNRERGIQIAINRANNGSSVVIPSSITDEVLNIRARAVRYFRTAEVID